MANFEEDQSAANAIVRGNAELTPTNKIIDVYFLAATENTDIIGFYSPEGQTRYGLQDPLTELGIFRNSVISVLSMFQSLGVIEGFNIVEGPLSTLDSTPDLIIGSSDFVNEGTKGVAIQSNVDPLDGELEPIVLFNETLLSEPDQRVVNYTVLHELGHALGLQHPFYFDNGVRIIRPELGDDKYATLQYTAMSYNELPHPDFDFSVIPTSFMLLDYLAFQNRGLLGEHEIGGNSYSWGSNEHVLHTIYDTGGIDEISASGHSRSTIIDLREGHFSSYGRRSSGSGPALENLAIAYGTLIENATGGSGADVLIGNAFENELAGGSGNDFIYGDGSTYDTTIWTGLDGSDQRYRDAYALTLDADNLVLNEDNDILHGNDGNDNIFGGRGDDELWGDAGNDNLYGGLGNDALLGGIGSDNYYFNYGEGLDLVVDDGAGDELYVQYSQGQQEYDRLGDFTSGVITAYSDESNLFFELDANGARTSNTVFRLETTTEGIQHLTIDIDGGLGGSITLADFNDGDYGFQLERRSLPDYVPSPMYEIENGINFNFSGEQDFFFHADVNFSSGGDPLDASTRVRSQSGPGLNYDATQYYTTNVVAHYLADSQESSERDWLPVDIPDFGEYEYQYLIDEFRGYGFYGSQNSDLLTGGALPDWLIGSGGDDRILGGLAHDSIFGGEGSDQLFGGAGNDMIFGNVTMTVEFEGSDYSIIDVDSAYHDSVSEDYIFGEDGSDLISGSRSIDFISGGIDDDAISGGLNNDILHGDIGNDIILGDSPFASIFTSVGGTNYLVEGFLDTQDVGALSNDDIIYGGIGTDIIFGEYGADTIDGGDDNDIIFGDRNNTIHQESSGLARLNDVNGATAFERTYFDTSRDGDEYSVLFGFDFESFNVLPSLHDDDLIYGGNGSDYVEGNGGADVIYGGSGNDRLHGDDFSLALEHHRGDRLFGGTGTDYIWGHGGNDEIRGGSENDFIDGGAHSDTIFGGEGTDIIYGDTQGEHIAEHGQDNIFGGSGIDSIYGMGGDDVIVGGTDNDQLIGGDGNDTYVFTVGDGQDEISDAQGNNILQFDGGVSLSAIKVISGTEMVILYGENDYVTIDASSVISFTSVIVGGDTYTFDEFIVQLSQFGQENEFRSYSNHTNHQVFGNVDLYTAQSQQIVSQLPNRGGMPAFGFDFHQVVPGHSPEPFVIGVDTLAANIEISNSSLDDEISIEGDQRNNIIDVSSISSTTINGGEGSDVLLGGQYGDTLIGGEGNDTLDGGQNRSTLINDTLIGGAGDDTLYVYSGDTVVLSTGDGHDQIEFEGSLNSHDVDFTIRFDDIQNISTFQLNSSNGVFELRYGNTASDSFVIDARRTFNQTPNQTAAEPLIYFDVNSEVLSLPELVSRMPDANILSQSSNGDDALFGSSGDDIINGQDGDDYLWGGNGIDTLNGGSGTDLLFGGIGNDILDGGTSGEYDELMGGQGDDRYVFASGWGDTSIFDGEGSNTIEFSSGVDPTRLRFHEFYGQSGVFHIDYENDSGELDRIFVGGGNAPPSYVDHFILADGTEYDFHSFALAFTSNTPPGSIWTLPDRVFNPAEEFSFFVGIFTDDGGSRRIEYSAELANGDPLPAWLNFDPETQTFSGTAGASEEIIQVRVVTDDGMIGGVSTHDFTFTVGELNTPPEVSNLILDQTVYEDSVFSFTVPADTFVDADGDSLALSAELLDGNVLPEWLSFDEASGTFTGVPTNDDVGLYEINVTANDGRLGEAQDDFMLLVRNTNDIPELINPIADQVTDESTTFSFTIPDSTFVDVDGDSLTIDASLPDGTPLPAWLSFDPVTRTLSGIPSQADVGVLDVRVTADDGISAIVAEDIFTLTINNINNAPIVALPITDQTAVEGNTFIFTVPELTFSDSDGDVLDLSASLANGDPLPTWLSFDESTATFSGTPTDEDIGSLDIIVQADDRNGDGIASDEFLLTIQMPQSGPAPFPLPDTVIEGSAAGEELEGGDSAELIIGHGGNDFLSGNGGDDVYQYAPGDGNDIIFNWNGQSTDTDTLLINNVGREGLWFENVGGLVITLLATGEQITVFQWFDSEDSQLDQIRLDNFSISREGVNQLTAAMAGIPVPTGPAIPSDVLATIGGVYDTAWESLGDPSDPNALPNAVDAVETLEENQVFESAVPPATDSDGSVVSYELREGVSLGLLEFNSDGSYRFDPDTDFDDLAMGDDRSINFTYIAVDNTGGESALATVTLTITGTNDAPTIDLPIADLQVDVGNVFNFAIPGGTFNDVDGDALSLSASLESGEDLPTWLTFDSVNAVFSGTPEDTDIGILNVRVTADDQNPSGIVSDVFTIDVQEISAPEPFPFPEIVIQGSVNSEELEGGDSAELLIGDAGDDFLSGNGGDDVYQYRPGDGNDIIFNWNGFVDDVDTLLINNVLPEGLWFENLGGLVITVLETGEQITVFQWSDSEDRQLDQIRLDGFVIDREGINTLTAVMADFPVPSDSSIPADVMVEVESVFNAVWVPVSIGAESVIAEVENVIVTDINAEVSEASFAENLDATREIEMALEPEMVELREGYRVSEFVGDRYGSSVEQWQPNNSLVSVFYESHRAVNAPWNNQSRPTSELVDSRLSETKRGSLDGAVLELSQVELLVNAMSAFDVPNGVGQIIYEERREMIETTLVSAW